jgi:uncharacterized membrane protein YphA (DoxX/SURF4 family)
MNAAHLRGTPSVGGSPGSRPWIFHPAALLVLRLFLAAIFIYAATQKIGKPLLFADEIRAYGVLEFGATVYIMAIVLPWIELFCGVSLVTGIMLRGSALTLLVMNAVFIAVISYRAAGIVRAGTPFLDVYFDCGCGFGATYAWKKLIEDAVYVAAALVVLVAPVHRFVISLDRRRSS